MTLQSFLIKTLFICFVFAGLPLTPAQAELRIDITKGVVEPMPIAVTPFFFPDDSPESFASKMAGVISADLESSGMFKPTDPQAFLQSAESISHDGVRFGDWRATGTQALVTGTLTQAGLDRTRVEFHLWDVLSEKRLAGMAYTTTSRNWRRIAHIISDEIYKRLTGEDGYFDSRIVYIAENGPPQRRIKRLAIMDQDGANHKYLTDGRNLVLTPRFSPVEPKITYMSYGRGGPQVYLYDISTGDHRKLGDFPGMTFAPRFSPDGRKVIMSLAVKGNSEIYEMDIRTGRKKRLTNSAGIDTAPSYAPNGRQIVFESDRGGSQQLYVMDSNGANVHRITFGKGLYGNPVWSPRGDLIAFTRIYKGQFYIGVIRPDGKGERLITNAYHVEGPTWSPNGRVLSYFKERPVGPRGERRQTKIYTIDITGYNERWLRTPQDGSDPAWSPLNK
jgi:TolB protein